MIGSWLLEKRKTILNSQPAIRKNIKPTCEHVLRNISKHVAAPVNAVSRRVALCCMWAYVRINEKTPTRCKRGAIGGKRSVLRACLQVVRYQDGSAVAGEGNRVSVSRSGEQRGTLADHIHHTADVELAIVDRSQVVGDAWLWRCDLAVGQVIHRSQIVKVFHRLGLLASNRESSAFGLYELAVVALGQVAKDRAVQCRVGSLSSRGLSNSPWFPSR